MTEMTQTEKIEMKQTQVITPLSQMNAGTQTEPIEQSEIVKRTQRDMIKTLKTAGIKLHKAAS